MKLATVLVGGSRRAAAVVGGRALLLGQASGGRLAASLTQILASDELLEEARALVERAEEASAFADAGSAPFDEAPLQAPIPRPGKVLCLGLNYRDHAAESGAPVPEEPVIFSKASSSVIGPGQPVRLPPVSDQIDYEASTPWPTSPATPC
jgi:2-keto-4-pentenoate hydratase/2-oxohepta-3-ene-1,7-dioic acid hydratase in catechol pathway